MLNENRESLSIPGFYVKDPQLGVRFLDLLRINKDISKSKGRGPKVQILKLALHYVVGIQAEIYFCPIWVYRLDITKIIIVFIY